MLDELVELLARGQVKARMGDVLWLKYQLRGAWMARGGGIWGRPDSLYVHLPDYRLALQMDLMAHGNFLAGSHALRHLKQLGREALNAATLVEPFGSAGLGPFFLGTVVECPPKHLVQ